MHASAPLLHRDLLRSARIYFGSRFKVHRYRAHVRQSLAKEGPRGIIVHFTDFQSLASGALIPALFFSDYHSNALWQGHTDDNKILSLSPGLVKKGKEKKRSGGKERASLPYRTSPSCSPIWTWFCIQVLAEFPSLQLTHASADGGRQKFLEPQGSSFQLPTHTRRLGLQAE